MQFIKTAAISMIAASVAGSVSAADLPSRVAPAPFVQAPVFTWTGFYIGLNAGGTFGSHSFATQGSPFWANPIGVANGAPATAGALGVVANSNASSAGTGFIGGGQLGCNLQFSNSFVAGLEADIQGLAGGGGNANTLTASSFGPFGFPANSYFSNASFRERLGYLGTVRGRLGYLVTPGLLAYVTGGLAYGGARVGSLYSIGQVFPGATPAVVPPVFGSGGASASVGWTIGGGGEWMFAPNWSAKIEYSYYNLGTATSNVLLTQSVNNNGVVNVLTPWGSALAATRTRIGGHIVRAGVNYHFNFGAPAAVVAKY